ncbi:hypothetical protein [Lacrimispora sp.]|uniref:hypothetical protein n=1 Tax=Lacrimispora sp. TaxID=2719234 RepID=UPI003994A833
MSYSVINGAVGKSPLIDKMNQLSAGEVKNRVPKQMEKFVSEHNEMILPPVSISFDRCREEIKRQLNERNQEMEAENGKLW